MGFPANPSAGQRHTEGSKNYIRDANNSVWLVEDTSGAGSTDLGYTQSATGGTVTSSTGSDATLPLADLVNAGLLSPADKAALDALGSVTGNFVGQAPTSAALDALTDPIGGGAPDNGDVAVLTVDEGGREAGWYIRTAGAWPATPFLQLPDSFTAADAILGDSLAGDGGAAATVARSDHRHQQSRGAVLPATDGSAGIRHVLQGHATLPDGDYVLIEDEGAADNWVQV